MSKLKIENIGVFESKKGFWEIIRCWEGGRGDDLLGKAQDKYRLIFVPNEDYSDEDIEITIDGEKLKDLIKMLKQF